MDTNSTINNTLVKTVSPIAWWEEESKKNTNQRVTDVISESMGETISIQDIDWTHTLLGKKSNGKSRPVIVKFVCYNTRKLIFKNKKKLKGSRISITENLMGQKNEKITNSKRRTWI